jgi:UDP-3-O-[3-hydroxymyristoyl] glucosamine N-acyltransferase
MNIQAMKIEELARLVGGTLSGDPGLMVSGFAPLEAAGPGEISFLVNKAKIDALKTSRAAAFLVPMNIGDLPGVTVIRVRDPNLAGAIIHSAFLATPFRADGIHPRAHVGRDCRIDAEVSIAPLAVIGDRVGIGPRVRIEAGVVIGDDVEIGEETIIKANAVISSGSLVGSRVIIHPGAVVGSDGFGVATDERGCHVKRPQVGIVRIDDDVEIGANTCIDRAAYGVTRIKSGVKIDNLVQIGHNVVVGDNSILVAQAGIAGSTTLGRNVVLGGKAGVKGHIHLDDRVMVAGGSGVHDNQPAGAVIGGYPAIPIRKWTKSAALFVKLPEICAEIKELKKDLAQLLGRNKEDSEGGGR